MIERNPDKPSLRLGRGYTATGDGTGRNFVSSSVRLTQEEYAIIVEAVIAKECSYQLFARSALLQASKKVLEKAKRKSARSKSKGKAKPPQSA